MMNKVRLEREILSVLNDAAPGIVLARTLIADVRVSLGAVTQADFDAAIMRLEQADGGAQIVGTNSDAGIRYKITAAGTLRLAEG